MGKAELSDQNNIPRWMQFLYGIHPETMNIVEAFKNMNEKYKNTREDNKYPETLLESEVKNLKQQIKLKEERIKNLESDVEKLKKKLEIKFDKFAEKVKQNVKIGR